MNTTKANAHERVLAEAAKCLGFTGPVSDAVASLAMFEARCLDWLAARVSVFVLESRRDGWWYVYLGLARGKPDQIAFEPTRHVALARAVLAIRKQEKVR